MTENEMQEYLQGVEGVLKSEMDDFFIVCSGKGRTGFFCQGAVEELVSDALEYMYTMDPEKALLTLTGLLVKISKWHQLYHEKVVH